MFSLHRRAIIGGGSASSGWGSGGLPRRRGAPPRSNDVELHCVKLQPNPMLSECSISTHRTSFDEEASKHLCQCHTVSDNYCFHDDTSEYIRHPGLKEEFQPPLSTCTSPANLPLREQPCSQAQTKEDQASAMKRHAATTLLGGSSPITQDIFLEQIRGTASRGRSAAELFTFRSPRAHKPHRNASPLLAMSNKQEDVMCSIAGCSDVTYVLSHVKKQVRKAIQEIYGIDKEMFATWFKNRRGKAIHPSSKSLKKVVSAEMQRQVQPSPQAGAVLDIESSEHKLHHVFGRQLQQVTTQISFKHQATHVDTASAHKPGPSLSSVNDLSHQHLLDNETLTDAQFAAFVAELHQNGLSSSDPGAPLISNLWVEEHQATSLIQDDIVQGNRDGVLQVDNFESMLPMFKTHDHLQDLSSFCGSQDVRFNPESRQSMDSVELNLDTLLASADSMSLLDLDDNTFDLGISSMRGTQPLTQLHQDLLPEFDWNSTRHSADSLNSNYPNLDSSLKSISSMEILELQDFSDMLPGVSHEEADLQLGVATESGLELNKDCWKQDVYASYDDEHHDHENNIQGQIALDSATIKQNLDFSLDKDFNSKHMHVFQTVQHAGHSAESFGTAAAILAIFQSWQEA